MLRLEGKELAHLVSVDAAQIIAFHHTFDTITVALPEGNRGLVVHGGFQQDGVHALCPILFSMAVSSIDPIPLLRWASATSRVMMCASGAFTLLMINPPISLPSAASRHAAEESFRKYRSMVLE